jgi:hypothetical protein
LAARAILKIVFKNEARMGKQTQLIVDDDRATIAPLSDALGHAVAGRQRGTMARETAER